MTDIPARLPEGVRWFHSIIQPIPGENGRNASVLCISVDLPRKNYWKTG